MFALFTRAWIEIFQPLAPILLSPVALFTRAWIEIILPDRSINAGGSRPLYEGVD